MLKDVSRCSFRHFLLLIAMSRKQASTSRSLRIEVILDVVILYDEDNFMAKVLGKLEKSSL